MQPHASNDGLNANPVSAQTAVVLSPVTYLADPAKEISRYLNTWASILIYQLPES